MYALCVFVGMCILESSDPQRPEETIRFLGAGVDSHALPDVGAGKLTSELFNSMWSSVPSHLSTHHLLLWKCCTTAKRHIINVPRI